MIAKWSFVQYLIATFGLYFVFTVGRVKTAGGVECANEFNRHGIPQVTDRGLCEDKDGRTFSCDLAAVDAATKGVNFDACQQIDEKGISILAGVDTLSIPVRSYITYQNGVKAKSTDNQYYFCGDPYEFPRNQARIQCPAGSFIPITFN